MRGGRAPWTARPDDERNDTLKAKELESTQKNKALKLELQDAKDYKEELKQKLRVTETTLVQYQHDV